MIDVLGMGARVEMGMLASARITGSTSCRSGSVGEEDLEVDADDTLNLFLRETSGE